MGTSVWQQGQVLEAIFHQAMVRHNTASQANVRHAHPSHLQVNDNARHPIVTWTYPQTGGEVLEHVEERSTSQLHGSIGRGPPYLPCYVEAKASGLPDHGRCGQAWSDKDLSCALWMSMWLTCACHNLQSLHLEGLYTSCAGQLSECVLTLTPQN